MTNYKHIIFENWPNGFSYDWLDEEKVKKDKFEYEKWQMETLIGLCHSLREVAERLGLNIATIQYRIRKYGITQETQWQKRVRERRELKQLTEGGGL